jgi:cupredoxin-like protein
MFEDVAGSQRTYTRNNATGIRGFPTDARADDSFPLGLTPKDHVFDSAELKAPAGRDIAITLTKEDESFEEFDSDALRAEMIVTADGKVTIKLKPRCRGPISFPRRISRRDGTGFAGCPIGAKYACRRHYRFP